MDRSAISAAARRGYDRVVDPACLWSWLTSRWLVQVALERDLKVRWRPYSLLLRNGPQGLEDWKAAVWGASLRSVRVLHPGRREPRRGSWLL